MCVTYSVSILNASLHICSKMRANKYNYMSSHTQTQRKTTITMRAWKCHMCGVYMNNISHEWIFDSRSQPFCCKIHIHKRSKTTCSIAKRFHLGGLIDTSSVLHHLHPFGVQHTRARLFLDQMRHPCVYVTCRQVAKAKHISNTWPNTRSAQCTVNSIKYSLGIHIYIYKV